MYTRFLTSLYVSILNGAERLLGACGGTIYFIIASYAYAPLPTPTPSASLLFEGPRWGPDLGGGGGGLSAKSNQGGDYITGSRESIHLYTTIQKQFVVTVAFKAFKSTGSYK